MTRLVLYANSLLVLAPLLHWLLLLMLPPGAVAEMRAFSVLMLLVALIPASLAGPRPAMKNRNPLFFSLAAVIVSVALVLYFQMVSIRPLGMWDAWSQWNLKARDYSLSFLQGYDFILTRPEWFNAQYPPAYPLFISFWTVLLGEWSASVPIAVNAILYALPAMMLLTVEGGQRPARRLLGLAVLIMLMFVPQIWLNATNLCADTYLATILLFSVYWGYRARTPGQSFLRAGGHSEANSSWMLFYAFLNAGFLLLAKPEGMILAPFAIGTILLINGRRILRSSPVAFAPLLLMALLLVWFKAYAVERVQYEVVLQDVFQRLVAWDRYDRLFAHFVTLNILSAASVLFVLLGLALRHHWKKALLWSSPLMLALACYHGIFIITPIDQQMHLLQAYARISMHIYPALLFLLFLVIRGGRLSRAKTKVTG